MDEQFYIVEEVPNTRVMGGLVFYFTGPFKTSEEAKASLSRIGTYTIVKAVSVVSISLEL